MLLKFYKKVYDKSLVPARNIYDSEIITSKSKVKTMYVGDRTCCRAWKSPIHLRDNATLL